MRYGFRVRELLIHKGWRADRRSPPYALAPVTWQGWTLTALWVAAMAITLIAAALEGLRPFVSAALATGAGTAAVLWMLRERVKPVR